MKWLFPHRRYEHSHDYYRYASKFNRLGYRIGCFFYSASDSFKALLNIFNLSDTKTTHKHKS